MTQNEWWKQTVIYQIYPRSFYDSNGDGIGDLEGVIQKLDYIEDLGVETIWLSPFFKSPQRDFGYDISDYLSIAEEYGDMKTVEKLIDEIHKRNMKIVLDMVMNHTSNEHSWFIESRDKDSAKADYYVWAKGKGHKGKRKPTNWRSMTGPYGWRYDEIRKEWYYASFMSFQPDLNYHNPEVKKAMFHMVRFWLNKGVDGFRLDIFNAIYKDPSLKNNPLSYKLIPEENDLRAFFQNPIYTINHPLNFEFAKELRQVIDEEPKKNNRFLIGEVVGKNETIRKYLGEKQDGLNLIFLFETLKFKLTSSFFHQLITTFEKEYPAPYVPVYVFSNHDRKRSISRIENNIEKAKMLAFIQLTVRGVPVIYYGEELGMEQTFIPRKQALDPVAKILGWLPDLVRKRIPENFNRDECRTPMQWSNQENGGFTSASSKPWLPLNDNYKKVNVEHSQKDKNSLLHTYCSLLQLRKQRMELRSGSILLDDLIPSDKELLSYSRTTKNGKLFILANLSNNVKILPVDIKNYTEIYKTNASFEFAQDTISLSPWSGIILETNS